MEEFLRAGRLGNGLRATGICIALLAGGGERASAAGPTLPSQGNRALSELTALVVTNTASAPTNGTPGLSTNTYIFNYANRAAFLAAGWNFIASNSDSSSRNTEITNTADGGVISYDQSAHSGILRVPCDLGDLWAAMNTSRNAMFRSLAPNWTTMRLALNFNPTQNNHQVHLAMYQDDDNFVQAGFAFNTTLGGQVSTLIWEYGGTPNHFFAGLSGVSTIRLRMDHDLVTGNITGYYSLNGTTWNNLGTTSQSLVNPRLCIWVGGAPNPWTPGSLNCDLTRLDVVASNSPAPMLTYQLVNPPSGATIDSSGIIRWTPSEAQGPATNVLTTIVTDNSQPPLSATNSFTVVVNEVNVRPVLPGQTNMTIVGLAPSLVVTNTATDADLPANALAYQLLTAPTNAAIDANGIITWEPVPSQIPSTNLFVTVVTDTNPNATNSQHLSATNSFIVVALAQLPPNGPVLPVQTNRVLNELTQLVVTNTASDANLAVNQWITNSFLFDYTDRTALLADGWSFLANAAGAGTRDTEITAPNGDVSYDQAAHPGLLQIPCDVGDLWGGLNSTRNSLFHALPTGWVSLQLALTFSPHVNTEQAHLGLYQDDDNYTQIGLAYNSGRGGSAMTMDAESHGAPNAFASAATSATNLHFRLDRNGVSGAISGYWSSDGVNWNLLGTTNLTLTNPRLGIWTGGSQVPYSTSLNLLQLDIVVSNNSPTALSYVLVNPPAGASIDTNGIIRWTPSEAQGPSTNLLTTRVSDNGLPPTSATNSFTVVVNEVNTAPQLRTITNFTVAGTPNVVVTNTATDTDLPVNLLTYQLTTFPPGAGIDTNGIIRWTPSLAQVPGVYAFTTIVTDSNYWAVNAQQLTATNSFTITVNALHNGPGLPAQTNRTMAELAGLRVTNTASDNDIPALAVAYSLPNGPSWAAIDTNGVITFSPGEANGPSTNLVTTVVTDNGSPQKSATNTFTLVVNELNTAPTLPAQSNLTLTGLQPLTVTNAGADVDIPANSLTYQLSGPAGASIDTNGLITWTPTPAQVPGLYAFTTVVTDFNPWAVNSQHLTATNTFNVTVNAIHNGPSLPAQGEATMVELTTVQVTNSALDNDVPALSLTYRLTNSPAWATINSSGVITLTPGEADGPSTNVITTIVTDNGSPQKSATNTFTLVVNEFNTAPTLPAQTNITLIGAQLLSVHNAAGDSDQPANSLSYQLTAAPSGAEIDAAGTITWTPAPEQVPSTNLFTTVATDFNPWAVNSQHLSATNSFTVIVDRVHNGPALPIQTNVAMVELTVLSVTNTATDTDTPALGLNYALVGAPAWASIDTNGVIRFTPAEADGPSTNLITAVVTDNWTPSKSATNSFLLVVHEINTAPVLPLQEDPAIVGLQTLLVTNTAHDSDLPVNSLSYELIDFPPGAAIDAGGLITWTPTPAQVPGSYTFTTVVTDSNPWAVNSQHLSATNTFTVTVNALHNAPNLPVQTNLALPELTTLRVTNTATANDLPALAFTYSLVAAPAWAAIDTNGIITLAPVEIDGPSTNLVTTIVTDNGTPQKSATNSFIVVVQEVNTPPVLPAQSNVALVGLQPLTITNLAGDSDLPANSITYALIDAPLGALIDANGVITWTPTVGQVPGVYAFTTVATDSNPWAINSQHLTATNSFQVTVTAQHDEPSLPLQTDLRMSEQTVLFVTNTATANDVPALALSYALLNPPAWATVDTNGVIRLAPGEPDGPATNVITTVVTDDGTPSKSATNSFTLVVEEINLAPVLPVQTNLSFVGAQNITITNTASDPDLPANALTYELTDSPVGAVIAPNGIITWSATPAQVPGVYTFTTVVTDDNPWAVNARHLTATNSFTVTLTLPPPPLVIESITVANGLATLTWDSVPGATYRLQYRDDASGSIWIDVTPDILATGFKTFASDSIASSSGRIYRIRLLP